MPRGSVQAERGRARREAIVAFVAEFWTVNEYGPSIREIARGVGLASASACHYELIALEREGRLVSAPSVHRSIRVVKP